MKSFSLAQIKFALIALVIAPLLVSLAWREAVRPCDYVAQAGLLLLMLALPFCTPRGFGFGRHFALLYLVGFIWGVWRVFYFDPVTQNDIPGIAYLIAPLMMGGISGSIFIFRVWLHGRNCNGAS